MAFILFDEIDRPFISGDIVDIAKPVAVDAAEILMVRPSYNAIFSEILTKSNAGIKVVGLPSTVLKDVIEARTSKKPYVLSTDPAPLYQAEIDEVSEERYKKQRRPLLETSDAWRKQYTTELGL